MDYPPLENTAPAVVDERPQLPGRGTARRVMIELVQTVLMVIGIYTVVNLAIPRYAVEGKSMQPSFNGEGSERVIVSRLDYVLSDPKRGDIIVLNNPQGEDRYIKRIVGLPGEIVTMEDGQVYINGTILEEPYIMELCNRSRCNDREWLLGEDEYFVLGDNRNNCHDSVAFGAIPRSLIVGRAWIRYWPPSEWAIFEHHNYGNGLDR